jgi:hypothetical protein
MNHLHRQALDNAHPIALSPMPSSTVVAKVIDPNKSTVTNIV